MSNKTSTHSSSKQLLLIAGERSGEEHAMSFVPSLLKSDKNLHLVGVGGDELKKEGMELLYHLDDFSSVGFGEVLGRIPFYWKAFHFLLKEVEKRKIQNAILVDFQEFNFRLAQKLYAKKIRVFYFVAPQVWAWRSWRTEVLKRVVHRLFCLFPFEKEYFSQRGFSRAIQIKHPHFHFYEENKMAIEEKIARNENRLKIQKILILPGSRSSEVAELLPIFLKTIMALQEKNKDSEFEVHLLWARPELKERFGSIVPSFITSFVGEKHLTSQLLWGEMAFAASGTVTLLCALFSLPTIVCYRLSLFSTFIFREFIKYKGYVSLPNIIMKEEVFSELLQERSDPFELEHCFLKWYHGHDLFHEVKRKLASFPSLLSGDSVNVGELIGRELI